MNYGRNVRRLSHPWLRREEAQQPLQPDNLACHGLCFSRCAPGTNRASLKLPVKRMLDFLIPSERGNSPVGKSPTFRANTGKKE